MKDMNEQSIEELKKEIEMIYKLQNEYIIKYYGIGIDNTKVNLKQIYSTNKASELMDLYGTESIFIEPFNNIKSLSP